MFLVTMGAMYWFGAAILARTVTVGNAEGAIPDEWLKRVQAYQEQRQNERGRPLDLPYEGVKHWNPREDITITSPQPALFGAGEMVSPEER